MSITQDNENDWVIASREIVIGILKFYITTVLAMLILPTVFNSELSIVDFCKTVIGKLIVSGLLISIVTTLLAMSCYAYGFYMKGLGKDSSDVWFNRLKGFGIATLGLFSFCVVLFIFAIWWF